MLSKQKTYFLLIKILILIFKKEQRFKIFLKPVLTHRKFPHPTLFSQTVITHLKSTAALGFQQKVRNSVIQYLHCIWWPDRCFTSGWERNNWQNEHMLKQHNLLQRSRYRVHDWNSHIQTSVLARYPREGIKLTNLLTQKMAGEVF